MTKYQPDANDQVVPRRIPSETLRHIGTKIFMAAGSSREEAVAISDHLVESNLVGHDSHGVIRIPKYLGWLQAGKVLANRHAKIIKDGGATVLIDGDFGYGQVIGREAMTITAERAHANGFAIAAIRNSGHLGRVGAWAEQLAKAGLVSLHFVNTSGFGILVAPHGGSDRRLSANPIAAGAPRNGGPPIILDIATSSIAEGKIQVALNKCEALPEGTVLDGAGNPTIDAAAFYADPPGAILPFGGHKGYGLSVFCEIVAGSLTGGGSSHPETPTSGRLVNNMLTLAFRADAFGEGDTFYDDINRLADWVTSSPPTEALKKPLLPGEIEYLNRAEREADGIPLDTETRTQICAAAESVGIPISDL